MSRISEEDINQIRHKAKIEDVIGHYIPVIRRGRSVKAVCPFHDDHDPSLNISTDKQIFTCFVCGATGNVFSFVQKYKKVSFPDAVREVAGLIGYPLAEEERKVQVKPVDPHLARLYSLLNDVILYSRYQITSPGNKTVLQYVLNRGITQQQIKDFQIGYLPDDQLHVFLEKKGYTLAEITESGMGTMSSSGIKDIFINRLMIPIFDGDGHPIAFTARTMAHDDRKYINTAQTTLYTKGNVLYNLHRAKESIRHLKQAVIVEGPMDAMALERAGIRNVVATLGTAVTSEQLALLHRYTDRVMFCYDGDNPGQNADFKGGQLAAAQGFLVQVARNDTNLDPDEIDRDKMLGPMKNRDMVEHPREWLDFADKRLSGMYDADSYEGKKRYAQAFMRLVSASKDADERAYYLRQTANKTGLNIQQLRSFEENNTSQVQNFTPVKRKESAEKPDLNITNGYLKTQYEIIKQMILSKQAAQTIQTRQIFLDNDDCNVLMMQILEYYRGHDVLAEADFEDQLDEDKLKQLFYQICQNELLSNTYSPKLLEDCLKRLELATRRRRKEAIKKQIASGAAGTQLAQLVQEYQSIQCENGTLEKESGKNDGR